MGYEIYNDCVGTKKKKPQDYIGHRFGMLVVEEIVGKGSHNKTLLRCKCDCGGEKIIAFGNLNTGHSNSCGCLEKKNYERLGNLNKTHGESKTRLYKEWKGIFTRCYNKNRAKYKDYGGRGIKVADEWNDFLNFKEWALLNGYNDTLTIDRIDVDGNYEPSNCRWATLKEQARNKRITLYATYNGVTKPLLTWAEELNLRYKTLLTRKRKGWSDTEVIEGKERSKWGMK